MQNDPHDGHVCYADRAWSGEVTILENVRLGRDTFRLRFTCPPIAGRILPGQFLMMRLGGGNDPLLGRPLAVYDVLPGADGRLCDVEVVYLTIGRMTRRLARLDRGTPLEVWGPLGNGFPVVQCEHLVMVAGGIGETPFLMLARECLGRAAYGDPPRQVPRAKRVSLCYGVRSLDYFAGLDDFRELGVSLHLSTDDGTAGHHGLVTDLIPSVLAESDMTCQLICCGPEPMMKSVAEISRRLNVPCLVSLETPMACGIGICFSCVAKIRDANGQWDYRRTCVDGPVFEADRVEF
jgi:dihydroorotate dehydrogenase electron transfer subunit